MKNSKLKAEQLFEVSMFSVLLWILRCLRMGAKLIVVFLIASCGRDKAMRGQKIRQDLMRIARATYSFADENHDLYKVDFSNGIVERFGSDRGHYLYKIMKNGKLLDPYGREYKIKYYNGFINVWSMGFNGVDENGDGDDIVYSLQISDKDKTR